MHNNKNLVKRGTVPWYENPDNYPCAVILNSGPIACIIFDIDDYNAIITDDFGIKVRPATEAELLTLLVKE